MQAQRNELLELVEKKGWKVTELDNYDFHRWSMETWLLESIWSPIGATAYVYFVIDPMSDFQNPYAWAIEVSKEKAGYRKNKDSFLASLKHWKSEKNDLMKFLEEVRNSQNFED